MTTTQVLRKIAKLEKELAEVKAEVLAGVRQDDEGEYKKSFVGAIRKALAEVKDGQVYSEIEVKKELGIV